MRRTLIALTAAGALAVGTAALPTEAEALPVWVIPAIVATAIVGVVVGAASTQAATPVPGPVAHCYWHKEHFPEGWRTVRVCY